MSIHLFGIQHAASLQGVNKQMIAELAGLPRSYGTEINKGVLLADYVQVVKALV